MVQFMDYLSGFAFEKITSPQYKKGSWTIDHRVWIKILHGIRNVPSQINSQLHNITAWQSSWLGLSTASRRLRSVWRQGDTVQRWFTAALTRTMTLEGRLGDRRGAKRQRRRRKSDVSSRWKLCLELEYFNTWLCDFRIYFVQARGKCGKTNHNFFGKFYLVCPAAITPVFDKKWET